MSCCSCFSALRPQYKRLVDSIYPANPEDGLVRSEMEKLTYYAASAPEKLDRIGDYLARRLTRDMARKREMPVVIAMEALNQLLLACHAQQINLFVESFLKMVATLLESDNPEFLTLGTNSFEKFSEIKEDTASYHRRYDFFVSKFSSMCHSQQKNSAIRQKVQLHGVRGLRGVIRKTVTDELQVNIWEKQHMDKIIPSLLYSMQDDPDSSLTEEASPGNNKNNVNHSALAEEALRELFSRATFANVSAALVPALSHMDNHSLWGPKNGFAIKCFKVIMYSIQAQYSHVVVKMLLDHLDENTKEDDDIKASMLQVLCIIVPIPSSAAIGPSVLDVFNRISKHLHLCADSKPHSKFEEALIETTGVLAAVVPDYQKLETMTFYVNRANEVLHNSEDLNETDVEQNFAHLLLLCLVQIAKTYHCSNISNLTVTLLEPLLKVAFSAQPGDRLLAQSLLASLLDKNKNYGKLKLVSHQREVESLKLITSTAGKYDGDFLERRLPSIYNWLYSSYTLETNTIANFTSLYKCAAVLCLSIVSHDVIMDVTRIMLAVQSVAVDSISNSGMTHFSCGVLASTSCCLLILAHVSAVPEFQHYVNQVIHAREKFALQFLPKNALDSHVNHKPQKLSPENAEKVYFNSSEIYNALKGRSGYNIEKLTRPFQANLQMDTLSSDAQRSIDVESINIEFSVDKQQSVVMEDGTMSAENITYEYLKQVFYKPPMSKEERLAKQKKLADHIRSAPFEQLLSEMQPDPVDSTQKLVSQLLEDEDLYVQDYDLESMEYPSIYAY
uniref:protein EFR3 homolog B-like n=1 Tax=Ciona intestinalis TaxID=7719 RepID=UPI000180C43B|nr:protein EFR3 homolog B-like [Ciona intestinalis]|eukprot:XP_002129458.1 protein EFR3 homolog B-like [Ciona intestinalis]